MITSLRNFFYNTGIFKSYKISKPVISIGNISTGGTGKSPFTIFIADYFLNNGFKPAIISRGYKRESDNIEIVFDGNKLTGNVSKCGDEPLMIANQLSASHKNFFVFTGSNRVKTAEFALNNFNPDVIILDDAFQHRKIQRDLDIVLLDSKDFILNKFKNLFVLPAGNLRENIGNLKRADILILNDKFDNQEYINKIDKHIKSNFRLSYVIKGFFDKDMKEIDINGKNVIAFAGIANPDSFFSKINSCDCKIVNTIRYQDHFIYSADDIKSLTAKADKDTIFVTTEKDFMKIKEFDDFLKYFCVLFMKIDLILNEENLFFDFLNKLMKDTKK